MSRIVDGKVGRPHRIVNAARWLGSGATRYSDALGWRRGLALLYRDRPLSWRVQGHLAGRRGGGIHHLRWPGYRTPFVLRFGGSDVLTFIHVIAERGYDLPWDVGSPRWIVDAGAHVGLSAVWFAVRFPSATVIAVEPEGDNFALLLRNTAGYRNVVPIQAALWSRCGTLAISDPGQGPWAFRVGELTDSAPSERAHTPQVEAIDMPTLLGRVGADEVDILKVDIEGAEKEVFESVEAWIDRVGVIAIELHDRFRPGCSRAFYAATVGFDEEVVRGEDLFVRRRRSTSPQAPIDAG